MFSKFAIQKSYAPCLGGSSMTGATAYMGGVGQSKHRAAKMATDIAQLKHSIAICFTKGPRLAPPCYLLSCWPPGARSGPHRPVTWLPWPTMLLEAQRSIQQNRRGRIDLNLKIFSIFLFSSDFCFLHLWLARFCFKCLVTWSSVTPPSSFMNLVFFFEAMMAQGSMRS